MMHEPFSVLTRKEEESRLLADGYDAAPGRWETLAQEVGHRARKRRRTDGELASQGEGQGDWGRPRPVPPVKEHGSVFYAADPVTLGWCSEEEGRELFKAYVAAVNCADARWFDYAYPFLPVLDPKEDNWEE